MSSIYGTLANFHCYTYFLDFHLLRNANEIIMTALSAHMKNGWLCINMLLCKASNHFLHTSNVLYNLVNALIMLSSDSIIVRTEKKKTRRKTFSWKKERANEKNRNRMYMCVLLSCQDDGQFWANFLHNAQSIQTTVGRIITFTMCFGPSNYVWYCCCCRRWFDSIFLQNTNTRAHQKRNILPLETYQNRLNASLLKIEKFALVSQHSKSDKIK